TILIAAGTPPDVFWTHSYLTADQVTAGQLYPIDELLDKDPQLSRDQFFEPALQDFMFDGKLYGLPRETSSLVLYYNQDMFDQSGRAYPDMSWTWETIVDRARKMTRRDPDGTDSVWGMQAPTGHAEMFTTAWQNGAELISEDLSKP